MPAELKDRLDRSFDNVNSGIVSVLTWYFSLDSKIQLAAVSPEGSNQREMLTLLLRQMLAEQATVADFGQLRDLDLPELLRLAQTVAALAAEKVKHYELRAGKGKKA